MKVLFLDVDGVLNSGEWFANRVPPVDMTALDPKAVARILRVLAGTGAHLVLSSSWRRSPDLVTKLKEVYGLPIIDVTPRIDGDRGLEIMIWLREHPEYTRHAVIDDDADAADAGNFVRTHWLHGMYGKHEKELIAMLNETKEKAHAS